MFYLPKTTSIKEFTQLDTYTPEEYDAILNEAIQKYAKD